MKPDRPWHMELSIIVTFFNVCISLYVMNSAVVSVQKPHPAENYANLALNLLGIPGFLFQATIMLILICVVCQKGETSRPDASCCLVALSRNSPACCYADCDRGRQLSNGKKPSAFLPSGSHSGSTSRGLILGTGGL